MSKTLVASVDDLFFRSKIEATARSLMSRVEDGFARPIRNCAN